MAWEAARRRTVGPLGETRSLQWGTWLPPCHCVLQLACLRPGSPNQRRTSLWSDRAGPSEGPGRPEQGVTLRVSGMGEGRGLHS